MTDQTTDLAAAANVPELNLTNEQIAALGCARYPKLDPAVIKDALQTQHVVWDHCYEVMRRDGRLQIPSSYMHHWLGTIQLFERMAATAAPTKAGVPGLTIEQAEASGRVIGWRLKLSGAHSLLVWADQDAMPGFRAGDAFVPRIGKAITYTATLPETATAAQEAPGLTDANIKRVHDQGACLPDMVGLKDQWPEILRFARAILAAARPAEQQQGVTAPESNP